VIRTVAHDDDAAPRSATPWRASIVIFLAILVVGLYYAWKKGALSWY